MFMPEALPFRGGRALAITLLMLTAAALLPARAQQTEARVTPVTDAMLLNPPPGTG